MLAHLLIKNYALIKHLEITPDAELNIITGETGAGKSIMLGAVGLLMGNRADGKSLYDSESKCFIEGSFEISEYQLQSLFESLDLEYENPCLIRREIAPSGKSRAFVNDTPVTLEVLKQLTEKLLDVHSQNDSILLGEVDYQLNLLDVYAGTDELLSEYRTGFVEFKNVKRELDKLMVEAEALKKEFDYNSFLLEELTSASIKDGEQEEAEEQLMVLENAEEVKSRLAQVSALLNHPEQSLISAVREAGVQLSPIVKYAHPYEELKKRLQSVQVELSDIAEEVERHEGDVEYNPEQIEVLKDRLDVIFRLYQKHQVKTAEDLKIIEDSLKIKVEQVLNFEDKLKTLRESLSNTEKQVVQIGEELSSKRMAVAEELENKVIGLLNELGIPNADFKIHREAKHPDKDGLDKIEFLFSANKGFALQGLKKVASGGEFSRLMLVLKYVLAEKSAMPSIIFDEIDTGISGEVAMKMGLMMRQMSKRMQVLAITHLHQIAGKGTSHFFVYKNDSSDKTVSSIRKLEDNERILEIAKMIGGENPSDSSIQSALELLE